MLLNLREHQLKQIWDCSYITQSKLTRLQQCTDFHSSHIFKVGGGERQHSLPQNQKKKKQDEQNWNSVKAETTLTKKLVK